MKLQKKLLGLLVILLPIQLGRHFWPSWSYLWQLRIDYLSPTIYLTDLIVVMILGIWGWGNKKQFTINNLQLTIRRYWWIFAFILFLLLNCCLAQNQEAAFYKLIKIIEFSFLGLYVAKDKDSLFMIRNSLFIPLIYSSLIVIAQFINQGSLGGFFWWLGERTFNLGTPGIAKTVINGEIFLRPYATFSHPNSLAGFLLISILLVWEGKTVLGWKRIFKHFAMILGVIAVILTFSRSVWLVGILATIWLVIKTLKVKQVKNHYWFLAGISLTILLVGFTWLSLQFSGQETVNQRMNLTSSALMMIKSSPLVGIGLNNFIVRLPNYWQSGSPLNFFQPVHNIYLLIGAETGILGLVGVLGGLRAALVKTFRTKNFIIHYSLFIILLLGLVDHYWLTLQQNQLLLTMVLGLSWAKRR